MPRRKSEEMSPAEWKVMTIVWRLRECAIGEVLLHTQVDPGWARSTVKTLLRRLIDKGYINAKRVGRFSSQFNGTTRFRQHLFGQPNTVDRIARIGPH